MRELSWRFGKAWIARTPADWPAGTHWNESASEAIEHRVAASARAVEAAVVVQLMCQTASGGSYFARLGGHLVESKGSDLLVRLRPPRDASFADPIERAVCAGLSSVPASLRPQGRLDIEWFAVHVVDFKTSAWSRAAAILCRLMGQDVAGMSDHEAGIMAEELASARTTNA